MGFPVDWKALLLPLAAGMAGAVGGVCGKSVGGDYAVAGPVQVILRGAWLVAMVVCNAAGGFLFAKALNSLPSTTATVLSTIASFVLSGVFGWWLFGESVNGLWLLGCGLMVAGVCCLLIEDKPKTN